jgi:hypothetical protein
MDVESAETVEAEQAAAGAVHVESAPRLPPTDEQPCQSSRKGTLQARMVSRMWSAIWLCAWEARAVCGQRAGGLRG